METPSHSDHQDTLNRLVRRISTDPAMPLSDGQAARLVRAALINDVPLHIVEDYLDQRDNAAP